MTSSQMPAEPQADFFVSYNGRDEHWAEWIAWQLEASGQRVIIQAWDFRPGSNFVLEMDHASREAKRTLLVLSPNFFRSDFTPSEWAKAFASDPNGTLRKIVPVVVEPCDVEGLLSTIVHIDVTGLNKHDAAKKLLAGIEPRRSKPASEPDFPGALETTSDAPRSPGAEPLQWQQEAVPAALVWKRELRTSYGRSTSASVVEIHLVPTSPQLLEVRRLSTLSNVLSTAGRQSGLFTAAQEVEGDFTETLAFARSGAQRFGDDAGLIVTRQGQRGGWLALPHDSMGSVLDPTDLTPRLTSLLALLLALDLPSSERFGVAAGLSPLMMLTVGDSSILGSRNTAPMRVGNGDRLELDANESILYSPALADPTDLAEEIVARLVAGLKTQR